VEVELVGLDLADVLRAGRRRQNEVAVVEGAGIHAEALAARAQLGAVFSPSDFPGCWPSDCSGGGIGWPPICDGCCGTGDGEGAPPGGAPAGAGGAGVAGGWAAAELTIARENRAVAVKQVFSMNRNLTDSR
jgi:hypothetical protein